MESGFDKEFEEFKNSLSSGNEASRSVESRALSQNTVDKFQEMIASMRKDTTDEFWKFMKDRQVDMETSFEGFMKTTEQEMDANFDQFVQMMMGEDGTRSVDSEYNSWKIAQFEAAYTKFTEFSKERKKREMYSDDIMDERLILTDYFFQGSNTKNTASQYCIEY